MECFFPNGAPSCWGARDRQPSVPSSSGASSSSSSSSSVSTDYGASSTAEDVTAGLDLTGRVYVVTGGTGAIGAEACRVLISRGASIVLAARDAKRANATVASIEGAAAKVIVLTCDLASMRSVRAFAAAFCALAMPLHGILCAAGIVAEPLFDLTEDGVERHFAINHLSHFLLVHELTNELVRTAASSGVQGRVVLVASSAHHFAYRVRRGVTKPSRGIDFANLNEPFGYTARGAYGQSKLANVLHAWRLTERLRAAGANVAAFATHPGAMDAELRAAYLDFPGGGMVFQMIKGIATKTAAQAAATPTLCLARNVGTARGCYYADCAPARSSLPSRDPRLAKALWRESERMCGLAEGEAAPALSRATSAADVDAGALDDAPESDGDGDGDGDATAPLLVQIPVGLSPVKVTPKKSDKWGLGAA